MKLSTLKKNPFIKFITNTYVLILIIFLVWMLFFDENSYLLHRKLNKEINELQNTITFYETNITKNNKTIEDLQDSLQLERFAREKYLMKKENEDIYIIEFDTIK